MVFIYILKLENNKYYVGKTSDPKFRLEQHFNYSDTQWTIKYKPIEILDIIPDCDDFDEDKYTLKTMEQYGIDNVRGGSFCELILSEDNDNTIQKMLCGSTNKCYICNKNGHFVKNCPQNIKNILINNDLCFRCHRKGHYVSNCYAKTFASGEEINDESEEINDEYEEIEVYCCSYCDKEFETLKGAKYHEKFYCKNNKTK